MKSIVSNPTSLQKAVAVLLPGTCLLLVVKLEKRCVIKRVVNSEHLPEVNLLLAESQAAYITCIISEATQAALAIRLALNRLERRYRLSNAKHIYTEDTASVVDEVMKSLHIYRPSSSKSNRAPTTAHEALLSQQTPADKSKPTTVPIHPDPKVAKSVSAMASRFGSSAAAGSTTPPTSKK